MNRIGDSPGRMMKTDDTPFPVTLLNRINREERMAAAEAGLKRTLWQDLDEFVLSARGEIDLPWPESVFMPFGLWPCFMERHFRLPDRTIDLRDEKTRGMAQVLSCLAPWRAMQDIVAFDPAIEAELRNMEPAGKLPCGILSRLPAWCVYIDAAINVNGDDYGGFFAQLDSGRDGLYMALTFHGADRRQERIPVLLDDFTLEESLAALNRRTEASGEATVRTDDPGMVQALNLVTYLCAYGFGDRQDYGGNDGNWPKPRKTKRGWRIFPPDKPKRHLLGAAFGERIRRDGAGAPRGGFKMRPHMRRPHWHHFWKGSAAERKLTVRWLPPIFVGDNNMETDIREEDA